MYKDCVTEESAQRQRQLEACLQELMQMMPYGSITISHICDLAGIARKSFYRYFSSKEGCLYAMIDHAIFDGASYYLPSHGDDQTLPVIYQRFFRFWKDKHTLLDALVRNNLDMLLVERMLDYISREENEFRIFFRQQVEDSHEYSLFYIGGIMALVLDWHRSNYHKSIQHMAKILSTLIR